MKLATNKAAFCQIADEALARDGRSTSTFVSDLVPPAFGCIDKFGGLELMEWGPAPALFVGLPS